MASLVSTTVNGDLKVTGSSNLFFEGSASSNTFEPGTRIYGVGVTLTGGAYTSVFEYTVPGGLAGNFRFFVKGTTGNVVIPTQVDVLLNHSKDITIKSQTGNYTPLHVKVLTNNNEDCLVQIKADTAANANVTVYIDVIAFGDGSVSFSSFGSYTGTSLEHKCNFGFAFSTINNTVASTFVMDGSNSGGRLGIGTNVVNADVEVSKSSTTNGPVIRLANRNDSISAGGTHGAIEFFSGDNSNPADQVVSSIKSIHVATAPNYGELAFSTGSNSEAVRINLSGNVGIGTTNPSARLDLHAGNMLIGDSYLDHHSSNDNYGLQIKSIDATQVALELRSNGGSNAAGTWRATLYGATNYYGFLDGAWANWDIRKNVNGALEIDQGSGLETVLTTATGMSSSTAWANMGAGTRTNYTLKFQPAANSYAGFQFNGTDGNYAGFFLIRGTSDDQVYTAEGITLVADQGWLTLAQRTATSKGVRIMTGSGSGANCRVRINVSTDGDIVLGVPTNSLGTATTTTLKGYSVQYDTGGAGARLSNTGFLTWHTGGSWTSNERMWAFTNAYNISGSAGPRFTLLRGNANNVVPTLGNNGSFGTNTLLTCYWSKDGVFHNAGPVSIVTQTLPSSNNFHVSSGSSGSASKSSIAVVSVANNSTFNNGTAALHVINSGNRGTKGNSIGSDLLRLEFSNGIHTIFDKEGNVGIGTTAPERHLHVEDLGQIKLENNSTGNWAGIDLKTSGGTNNYTGYFGMLDSNGNFFIDVASNGDDVIIRQNGETNIGLQGKVLVGRTAALNTANRLHVDNAIALGSSTYTFNQVIGNGGNLELVSNANPANLGTNSNIIFKLGTSGGGGPNEAMRIVSTGSVGIGTTIPGQKLDVRGDILIKGPSTSSSTHSVLRFQRGNATNDFATIGFENPALANDEFLISAAGNGNPIKLQSGANTSMNFYIGTTHMLALTTGALYPPSNGTKDLGLSGNRWNNVYSEAGNFSGVIVAGSTSTTGGSWLEKNYSGSNKINVLSSAYSSGNTIIGYGAKGKTSNSGFVATYGNFSGKKSVIELSGSTLYFKVTDSASQDTVGDDITLNQRLAVDKDTMTFTSAGGTGLIVNRTSVTGYLQLFPAYSNVPTIMGKGSGGLHLSYNSSTSGIRIDTSNNVIIKDNILFFGSTSGPFVSNDSTLLRLAGDGGVKIQTYVGGWQDRLTIIDDGNVGIGTTQPSQKLDVNGNTELNGSVNIVGGGWLSLDGNQLFRKSGNWLYLAENDFTNGMYTRVKIRMEGYDVSPYQDTANVTSATTLGLSTKRWYNVYSQAGNFSGTLTAGNISGNGSGLTSLNASNISSGTVAAARLGSGSSITTKFLRGDNTWQTVSSGSNPNNATITLSAGTNLSGGGNFTTNQSSNETITFNMSTGGAGAGTYGDTSNDRKIDTITLDAYGRVTAVATGITGDILGVTAGAGLSGGGTSGTVTLSMGNVGPGAGSHGSTSDSTKIDTITLDAQGRVTAIATGATGSGSMSGWYWGVDSSTATYISNGETVRIKGGTNVTVSRSGNDVTINASGGGGSGTVTSVATSTGLQGGTITTSGTLSVTGAVCMSINAPSGSAAPSSRAFDFLQSGGITISASGNNVTFSSSSASDYRLKKNVTDFNSESWTKVKSVSCRKFDFDAEKFAQAMEDDYTIPRPASYGGRIGFIAHELEAAGIDGAVEGEKDGVDEDGVPIYQKVSYTTLVPVLWGALNEAIRKIEILESKVQALEDSS